MKHLLITIVAVLWVGCVMNQSPKNPRTRAPIISIHSAAHQGSIEAVKQHLAAGTDVNLTKLGDTALDKAIWFQYSDDPQQVEIATNIADLLRKHGGKTGEELKASGN